uniref:Protein kinase domain-containing protein n=1 Tax=Bursaphelenchus xylophilus TaxID=6326 RepID=A0A1I7SIC3_BURXY
MFNAMYASAKNGLDPAKPYTLNDFEMKGKLGKGQFAECYKAKFLGDGTHYAIKRIQMSMLKDKKSKDDCRKEMDLLQRLRHENIIRYYVSFEDKVSEMILLWGSVPVAKNVSFCTREVSKMCQNASLSK